MNKEKKLCCKILQHITGNNATFLLAFVITIVVVDDYDVEEREDIVLTVTKKVHKCSKLLLLFNFFL